MPFRSLGARFQFTLMELFGLTTYAACVIASVKAWGPGTLICAAGWFLAWMNFRGCFQIFQTGNGHRLAIFMGWCGFVGSMFCPAIQFYSEIRGWEAAQHLLLIAIPPSFGFFSVDAWMRWSDYLIALPIVIFIDATNICGALAPLVLRWPQGVFQRYLGITLHVALIGVWVIVHNYRAFLVGYYLWAASLTLLACTCRVDRRTAIAMLVGTSILIITQYAGYLMKITL